jgi:hypothetical protein
MILDKSKFANNKNNFPEVTISTLDKVVAVSIKPLQ